MSSVWARANAGRVMPGKSSAGDLDRPARIGRMMASPNAEQRAYARYLVAHMQWDDQERANSAYREVDIQIRAQFAKEDRGSIGAEAERKLEAQRQRIRDAHRMSDEARAEEPFKPPCSLEQFLAAWKRKRSGDLAGETISAEEADRLTAEIRREAFAARDLEG